MSWRPGKIVHRHEWAEGLITLRIEADVAQFRAGQFVNLGLDVGGTLIRRSYSMASAPGEPLEFYLTRVSGGALTPRLFDLPLGSRVDVEGEAQGFFTLNYVPDARDLWLVATGTGLGPFISILRTEEPWRRFERIILAHGVRDRSQLGYRDELDEMSRSHASRLVRVPVLSREVSADGCVAGRVTSALEEGALEARAGAALDAERSHVMLCGNPAMIQDMTGLLKARGLKRHRLRAPGQISIEKYW
jgi:ferredoxin/flavodoxin---NADP+ reductase